MKKRPFFQAATAGLGKYGTGSYGRIGVYRKWNLIQCHDVGLSEMSYRHLTDIELPLRTKSCKTQTYMNFMVSS